MYWSFPYMGFALLPPVPSILLSVDIYLHISLYILFLLFLPFPFSLPISSFSTPSVLLLPAPSSSVFLFIYSYLYFITFFILYSFYEFSQSCVPPKPNPQIPNHHLICHQPQRSITR